jgi:hypothetical protein
MTEPKIADRDDLMRSREAARFPLAYTKININVKVGVHNEEFGRRGRL